MRIKFFIWGNTKKLITHPGGGEKSILLLISSLLKKGVDAKLVCFGNKNRETTIEFNNTKIEIKEYGINRLGKILPNIFFKKLYKILKREEDGTNIFHFYNVKLDPLAGYYKKKGGAVKLVSTLNNYCYLSPNFEFNLINEGKYVYNYFDKFISFFDLFRQNYTIFLSIFLMPIIPIFIHYYNKNIEYSKYIDRYIALSETVKKIYKKNGFRNITVIPNMYDNSFSTKIKNKKERSVLYVGRIKKSKGIDMLIKSFLKSKYIENGYKLKIIGAGNLLKSIRKKYHSQEKVEILGKMSYLKLKEEYKKADIFVHPGIWPEPFGRTILEAIQTDCRIIVSNIGEPPNIVGKKNSYKSDSIEELTQKLNSYFNNKKKGKINKNILEKYKTNRIVDKIKEIYVNLYNEKKNEQ